MRTSTRRLGAVVVTATLALGGALAPAQAAPNAPSQSAADWLGRQLTGGLVHNDQYKFDDYGLTLDVFFALQQIGAGASQRTAILDAFAKDPGAYISSTDPKTHVTDRYAGSTGKLATAVELGGRNPKAFGGTNLVTRLEGLLSTRSGEVGRGVDAGSGDFSNTIGQAWIVRALAAAGSAKKATATSFLLKQQCAAGFFRLTLEPATSSSAFSCDKAAKADKAPSIDATALAIEALEVAKAHGVTGLDDDISDAADWLVRIQRSGGAFVDQGTANSNSTGLAASALALVGRAGAAGSAAGWVLNRDVRSGGSLGKLAGDVGAVAYDTATYADGVKNGITMTSRDQWRRATAQAAPALQQLLRVKTLAVTGPAGYRAGGSVVTFSTRGLTPGERFTTEVGAVKTFRGVVGSTGTAKARIALPRATKKYTVTTQGSRAARVGRTTVKVLGAKKLRVALATRPIRARHTERLSASGLAAYEHVRVYYRGARIWSGTASAHGTVVHRFKAGARLGVKKVVVLGAFANRSATTHLRVVR